MSAPLSADPPVAKPSPAVRVAAFDCFAPVADPAGLAEALRAFGLAHGLVGSIIIAGEGANGTIVGTPDAIAAAFDRLRAEPGFGALAPRLHDADALPFARWKVKVKPEIVAMGVGGVDARDPGMHVAPADWNALIADLIDTRKKWRSAGSPARSTPARRGSAIFPADSTRRPRNGGARAARRASPCIALAASAARNPPPSPVRVGSARSIISRAAFSPIWPRSRASASCSTSACPSAMASASAMSRCAAVAASRSCLGAGASGGDCPRCGGEPGR